MKKSHFYKAKSRIGLTHPPVRQTEFNYGVEDGAEAILTSEFVSQFPDSKITNFIFSDPDKIPSTDYVAILVKEFVDFKNIINNTFESDEIQLVVGGDNTVTFSSFLALLERVGDISKVGYIQFDSHGESNSYEGSDSKNFHGMYMRPFFDEFDIEQINRLIPKN